MYPASTPHDVQRYIQAALSHVDHTEVLPFSSHGDAQTMLDEIWRVLDSPVLPDASRGEQFSAYRNQLRQLSLKLSIKYDILPTLLILKGVRCTDDQLRGVGGFADVYCGTSGEVKVALKRLRVYLMMSDAQKQKLKNSFYRESMLWKNLVHDHVLPFLGVSEDAFPGMVCMVIPWMENGNLRHYIEVQKASGKLVGDELMVSVNEWLHQVALGLAYLHVEGIVHGDLHAGNVLIDENGHARLTDFGMALISGGNAYNYGSQHGGGATRWSAPELFEPREFGLDSSRPTFNSDIYSFACVIVETYTGEPPFAELSEVQVIRRVVDGARPGIPSFYNEAPMSNSLWSLTQSCWSHKPSDRPSAQVVATSMSSIVIETYTTYTDGILGGIRSAIESNAGLAMLVKGSSDSSITSTKIPSLRQVLRHELTNLLDTSGSRNFLKALRDQWAEVGNKILRSPTARTVFRSVPMTCVDGTIQPFEHTFIATKDLAQHSYLSFLPIDDPDDLSWAFLEKLGVSRSRGGWLYCLRRLIHLSATDGAVSASEVDSIYRLLSSIRRNSSQGKMIRSAFRKYPLIYYPGARQESVNSGWKTLEQVVWSTYPSVRSKAQLAWQWPYMKDFFQFVGVPSSLPPGILLDELRLVRSEYKGQVITDQVHFRVSDILHDVEEVARLRADGSSRVEQNWVDGLRRELVFPVTVPSLGLDLLSVDDHFYIPDDDGSMSKAFTDIPLLAYTAQGNKLMHPLETYRNILRLEEFRFLQQRRLDRIPPTETNPIGKPVAYNNLTRLYNSNISTLRELFSEQLPYEMSRTMSPKFNISVHRVDAVAVTFVIDGKTHTISDDFALRLSPEKLEIFIALSRIDDDVHREELLAKKIAKLFRENWWTDWKRVHRLLTVPETATISFADSKYVNVLLGVGTWITGIFGPALMIIGVWFLHRWIANILGW